MLVDQHQPHHRNGNAVHENTKQRDAAVSRHNISDLRLSRHQSFFYIDFSSLSTYFSIQEV